MEQFLPIQTTNIFMIIKSSNHSNLVVVYNKISR